MTKTRQTPSDLPADVAAFIDGAIGRTLRAPPIRRPVVPTRPDAAGFAPPRRTAAGRGFQDLALVSLLALVVAAAILVVAVAI
ncbi:MAG TPA: hypothetical protein VM434_17035 [Beijerinckiaceae bacterium]|nr:hypothetical protein [Beijerinckiaceae bacterium]